MVWHREADRIRERGYRWYITVENQVDLSQEWVWTIAAEASREVIQIQRPYHGTHITLLVDPLNLQGLMHMKVCLRFRRL